MPTNLQAYQKLGRQAPAPVLKDRATELETLEAAMQEFHANSEKDLRTKYGNKFPGFETAVESI